MANRKLGTKRGSMPRWNTGPAMVRVIKCARDASRDYFIKRDDAERLYRLGRLVFDETNGCYGEKGRD